MVALDHFRGLRTALYDIGIDGALRQKFNAVEFARLFLEHADKFRADDLALLLRFCHTGQLIQEAVDCIHIDQIRVHLVAEYLDDLLRFTLTQQTVIHVDAYKLLPDRANQKRRYNGRIHAAG